MNQDPIIQKIIDLLEKQGKTQKNLTDYLSITQNAFTDWKSGRIKSYRKHLAKIAEFLDVSVDFLLGKEPEKKPTARVLSLADALTPREISVAIAYRTHPNEQAAVDKLLDVPASDDELTVYIAAHFGKADSEGYKTMTGAEWAELESTPETDQDLT